MITQLTDKTFVAEVVNGKKPWLVVFATPKCAVCKKLDLILEDVTKKNTKVAVGKVDVSKYPALAKQHVLGTLPEILLFARGIVNCYVGKHSVEAIVRFLAIHN